MHKRPQQHPKLRYKDRRSSIGTWLLREERDRLYALALAHGVTAAAYLRAVVADIIAEDATPSSIEQGYVHRGVDAQCSFEDRRRPISTWVLNDEHNRLRGLAEAHGVSLAVYLRAVLTDVLVEEAAKDTN